VNDEDPAIHKISSDGRPVIYKDGELYAVGFPALVEKWNTEGRYKLD
jgi:hypothetical protein